MALQGELITEEPKKEEEIAEVVEVQLHEQDVLNPQVDMSTKMKIAGSIADSLKNVVEKQGLAVELKKGQPKYVTVEGWNTLGTILGITPVTEEVVPFPTKARFGFKARVSIYNNGNCLATAEAIATSAGFQKEEYAVYSMAQTRALGKAYRMALSWIMKLAGYSATPKEEMEEQIKGDE